MLQIAFWFSSTTAAAMKIVIKLSDAFDISNDFFDTGQMKNIEQ